MDKVNVTFFENILVNLYESEKALLSAFRFSDIYDDFMVQFTTYVSPYIWIIPLIVTIIVTIIVVVTFKRAKLFGVTQKLLVLTMTMDMFFALFAGIRDGALTFLNMNYGFVEYKICKFLLISFRIQGVVHGSSLMLKSLMTARIVGLFAFPMKFRNLRLKKWVAMFLLIHVLICTLTLSFTLMISVIPVTTVQEYKHGVPLKIIQACVINFHNDYLDFDFMMNLSNVIFVVQLIYFLFIPILFQMVCIVALSVIMKKQIKAVMNMMTNNRQRAVVKYLRLMKISLLLGISFLIQEIPLVVTQLYGFSPHMQLVMKSHSLSYFLMTISYAVWKPIDLLIYSTQSKNFTTTLSKWICRIKRS